MRPRIKASQGGVMKTATKSKKQPTREDLAAAFRTIRDQYQIKAANTDDFTSMKRC